MNIHTIKNLTALFINKVSLNIHNIVVLKYVTSHAEVLAFNLLLGTFDLSA